MPEQQREGRGAGHDAGPGLGRQRKRWMTTAGLGPRRDEKMGQVLYFAYGSNLDDEQPGYFRVLWRAYARLGFDVAPLATAAGVEP